jgi:hypothetical protein
MGKTVREMVRTNSEKGAIEGCVSQSRGSDAEMVSHLAITSHGSFSWLRNGISAETTKDSVQSF